MSLVQKRCACGEAKWPKCPDPWYLKKLRDKGVCYAPNLTRLARAMMPQKPLTTKTEAETFAASIRLAIQAGTYVAVTEQTAAAPVTGQTVAAVVAAFDAAVLQMDVHKRKTTKAGDRGNLAAFAAFVPPDVSAPIGTWPITHARITDVIAFRNSPRLATAANSTWAKYRTTLAQFFRWATSEGYLEADPFITARPDQLKALRRGKGGHRERRIDLQEEAALIRAAGKVRTVLPATRLQSLIVVALETGMRQGELLALLWGDVDFAHRRLFVRAKEVGAAKTGKPRPIPMSQRVCDELQTLILDPAGDRFGRAAYVFGDAVGGRVKSIRKAWDTAVLRAAGHEPSWTATALSAASRELLARIDLHFHDLRHEAGSRWLESKAFDLGQIQAIYGHTTVAQTAAYLHAGSHGTDAAMAQFDAQRKTQAIAAVASETRRSGYKVGTNSGGPLQSGRGPRLVKGSKGSDSK